MVRGRRRHDDLLSGFTGRAHRAVELRGLFASTIGASLVAWKLAFDFGAYGTVLYSHLFQLLVVSLVLLLGAVSLGRQIAVRSRTLIVLCVPSIWLAFRFLVPLGPQDPWYHITDQILTGLTVLSLPLTLWALARIIAPEYFALSSRRLRATAIGIVAVVALTGFLVGRFNYLVLACQDFVVAGDYTPANCQPP